MKKNTINKKMRSGFTMVELLFVMAVMAALAAIAIPQLAGGKDSAIMTGMKSDARNAITHAQQYYALNDVYPATVVALRDNDGDGLSDDPLGTTGTPVSDKDSYIGFANAGNGCFTVEVVNANLDNKIVYDSCNAGKIKSVPKA